VDELSSWRWDKLGLLLGFFDSDVPPVDLGNAVVDEPGEVLWRDPKPLNTKRDSIASRLFA
jgi:hypothetical protein